MRKSYLFILHCVFLYQEFLKIKCYIFVWRDFSGNIHIYSACSFKLKKNISQLSTHKNPSSSSIYRTVYIFILWKCSFWSLKLESLEEYRDKRIGQKIQSEHIWETSFKIWKIPEKNCEYYFAHTFWNMADILF